MGQLARVLVPARRRCGALPRLPLPAGVRVGLISPLAEQRIPSWPGASEQPFFVGPLTPLRPRCTSLAAVRRPPGDSLQRPVGAHGRHSAGWPAGGVGIPQRTRARVLPIQGQPGRGGVLEADIRACSSERSAATRRRVGWACTRAVRWTGSRTRRNSPEAAPQPDPREPWGSGDSAQGTDERTSHATARSLPSAPAQRSHPVPPLRVSAPSPPPRRSAPVPPLTTS